MQNVTGRDFSSPEILFSTVTVIEPIPVHWVTGYSRGVKWWGLGINHPLPSSAEVKERVELSLLPVYALMAGCRVQLSFTLPMIPPAFS